NFLGGGAAINVLARQAGARVAVVDLGVAVDLPDHPDLTRHKIGAGTANLAVGPAMSRAQALAALAAGIEVAESEIAAGADLRAPGDWGPGTRTAASATAAAPTAAPPRLVTGRGTGIGDAQLRRKIRVVERALKMNAPDPADAVDVLAKVGGFEIGGLAGLILGAAAQRLPVPGDGLTARPAAPRPGP